MGYALRLDYGLAQKSGEVSLLQPFEVFSGPYGGYELIATVSLTSQLDAMTLLS